MLPYLLQLVQLVLLGYIVVIRHNHASHPVAWLAVKKIRQMQGYLQPSKRRDAIPLANPDDRGIDVSSAGLESAIGVCDGTPRVVMEVCLNI